MRAPRAFGAVAGGAQHQAGRTQPSPHPRRTRGAPSRVTPTRTAQARMRAPRAFGEVTNPGATRRTRAACRLSGARMLGGCSFRPGFDPTRDAELADHPLDTEPGSAFGGGCELEAQHGWVLTRLHRWGSPRVLGRFRETFGSSGPRSESHSAATKSGGRGSHSVTSSGVAGGNGAGNALSLTGARKRAFRRGFRPWEQSGQHLRRSGQSEEQSRCPQPMQRLMGSPRRTLGQSPAE